MRNHHVLDRSDGWIKYKRAIFYSYVKLPDGSLYVQDSSDWVEGKTGPETGWFGTSNGIFFGENFQIVLNQPNDTAMAA